ncbi:MAG: LptE family protein, partial [Candidatus Omnitrophota bacterium]
HGCGYTTRSSLISTKYLTIFITPFINKIDITLETDTGSKYKVNRPMIESEVTRTVVNKYLFDGNLKPVKEATADLVLTGEVTEFRRDPLRYTESDDVEEYRLSIAVNLKLVDKKNGDVLVWEENGFTGSSTYFVKVPSVEPSAITDAVQDLARRIVERTVDDW